ncbi:MAG: hypothetical protein AAF710_04845 [Planctomycetota bacterium]
MPTLIHERVRQAQSGDNPKVIARTASGWVVIGDTQFLRGYSLLLPDPVVGSINDMDEATRARYALDMVGLGDALLQVTGARRINYEILGNTEAALHTHLFPRYDDEPEALRPLPVWQYGREVWTDPAKAFDPQRDAPLMESIREALRDSGLVTDG